MDAVTLHGKLMCPWRILDSAYALLSRPLPELMNPSSPPAHDTCTSFTSPLHSLLVESWNFLQEQTVANCFDQSWHPYKHG